MRTLPIFTSLLFLLSGCGGYGAWKTLNEKGPRIAGGNEVTIQERCTGQVPMSDAIQCETAVLDKHKNRASIKAHMEELERYLLIIPQISPWITASNGPNKGPGPYKLYLISWT